MVEGNHALDAVEGCQLFPGHSHCFTIGLAAVVQDLLECGDVLDAPVPPDPLGSWQGRIVGESQRLRR